MASNRIEMSRSSGTPLGADALAAIDDLRRAKASIDKVKGIMAEFSDDTNALAAQLGITGDDAAAQAAIVRGQFGDVLTVLSGADVSYMLNRLGQ